MDPLVVGVNDILKGHGFEYAVCGGFAIDLFLGHASRRHGDVDIAAYWDERNSIILYMQSLGFAVYEMLGGGKAHHITDINRQFMIKRNIFCCKDDCELVSFVRTEEDGVYIVEFEHAKQTRLNFIEFLFNHRTAEDFVYARNGDIKQSLSDAVLYRDAVPYLSPEICLLYKSTDTEREGYQSDYDNAMLKMDGRQREWLNSALKTMFPNGHKWMI